MALIALAALAPANAAETGLPSLGEIDARRASFATRYEALPRHVIDAVVAAEDRDYWEPRLNPFASPIATYAADMLLLDLDDRSVRRTHVQRLLFLARVRLNYTREQVLEIMLNLAYFGNGATGLESAARVHFDKPVSELELAEAAFLAALIRAPSFYVAPGNDERLLERRNFVLSELARMKWISEAELRTALDQPIPK